MADAEIISAFAGCGKTEMARRHPDLAIDLESSDYRWTWPPELRDADPDTRKGLTGAESGRRQTNPEWPHNYVGAICDAYESGKWRYVLISQHIEVIEMLVIERGLPVTRAYPSYADRDDYLERYRRRGNAEPFVQLMGRLFDTVVLAAEQTKVDGRTDGGDDGRSGGVIHLESGQFLEDVLAERPIP